MSDSPPSYAETIAKHLTGKMVEIYTGDNNKAHNYSDFDIQNKAVIRGKVVEAINETLIVDALVIDITDEPNYTRVWINDWCITAITEYVPDRNIENIYWDEDIHNPKKMRR